MTRKEEEELKNYIPPKRYSRDAYLYNIKHCPGYNGYIPENLNHEVCKYCGDIKYYH